MNLSISDYSFTGGDRRILEALTPVAEALARFMGSNCEVVIHSFENLERSIIFIENGHVSGRTLNDPIGDMSRKILDEAFHEQGTPGMDSYFSTTQSGDSLKSMTVPIRNPEGVVIGMFCLNLNLSAPLAEIIGNFVPGDGPVTAGEDKFSMSIEKVLLKTIEDTMSSVQGRRGVPSVEKNKTMVAKLYEKGIFDIKGAIDLVAREIGVSRYTVYNYLREIKVSPPGG